MNNDLIASIFAILSLLLPAILLLYYLVKGIKNIRTWQRKDFYKVTFIYLASTFFAQTILPTIPYWFEGHGIVSYFDLLDKEGMGGIVLILILLGTMAVGPALIIIYEIIKLRAKANALIDTGSVAGQRIMVGISWWRRLLNIYAIILLIISVIYISIWVYVKVKYPLVVASYNHFIFAGTVSLITSILLMKFKNMRSTISSVIVVAGIICGIFVLIIAGLAKDELEKLPYRNAISTDNVEDCATVGETSNSYYREQCYLFYTDQIDGQLKN